MKITDIDLKARIEGLQRDAFEGRGSNKIFIVEKNHVACIEGFIYEPSYESFSASHSITLDGILLFKKDAKNVAAYRNEVYTIGECKSSEEAIEKLKEVFGDNEVKLVRSDIELENEQEDEEEF